MGKNSRVRICALKFILCGFWGLIGFLTATPAQAQLEHQLVRRLVVFPIAIEDGAQQALVNAADDAWWQLRDVLTKSQRFLVASKQFLIKNDALQPRRDLEPADAIILGRVLDAHALITVQVKGKQITLNAYDGSTGQTLYQKTAAMHPSLAVSDQLASFVRRMVGDFIATIPYQGFTVIDPLVGQPVQVIGDVQQARIEVGRGTKIQVGDAVQWIRLISTNAAPIFQGGAKTVIVAQGRIIRLEDSVAVAEILRAGQIKDVREFSLVQVPREAERLIAEHGLVSREGPRTTLTPGLISPEANPQELAARERRPLLTTLTILGCFAGFLLIGF